MKTFRRLIPFLLVLVAILALTLFVATPVYAQGENPSEDPVPTQVGLLNIAFFVATVSFFKARFGWEDNKAFAASVGVGLVFALLPQISELVPVVAPWLDTLARFVIFVVVGTGAYNAAIDIGGKIKTFKA